MSKDEPFPIADQLGDAGGSRPVSDVSPLTTYGLRGLRRCWMPEQRRWSHKYHLDGRMQRNESRPHSDIYYSLNVLLGLARVREGLATEPYDVAAVFGDLCQASAGQQMRNGAWGMALWAAAEWDLDPPGVVAAKLRNLSSDLSPLVAWTAQDVGLSLSGATAQSSRDASWRPLTRALRDLLLSRFRGPGVLFRDSGSGLRRHFGTFATQVYAALSLYQYGEFAEDTVAIEAANACVVKLLALQGQMGEWPWFYWPGRDRVLDRYEVYSVHQHGMGPALLHHAVGHGVPGARAAIVKGFSWIFGANEMAVSMLVPAESLIYRSQARRGVGGRRDMRLLRAVAGAATGGGGGPAGKSNLRLTEEMRSYEFGWLLWSFGGRVDYLELTHRLEFDTRG